MIFHDVEQGSDEWKQLRIGKLTSSRVGVVMANDGKGFGDPAVRLMVEIALERLIGYDPTDGFTSSYMERGIALEPIARAAYEEETFSSVTNGGFFDHDTYGDSPDGLVGDDGLVEIKVVTPAVHYQRIIHGGHDTAYTWQIVSHIDCTGRDWCDFVSYCPDFPEPKKLFIHRVNRSDVLDQIERLRVRRTQFLKRVDEAQQMIAG